MMWNTGLIIGIRIYVIIVADEELCGRCLVSLGGYSDVT